MLPLKPHDDLLAVNVLELQFMKREAIIFDGALETFDHLVPEFDHWPVALLEKIGNCRQTMQTEYDEGEEEANVDVFSHGGWVGVVELPIQNRGNVPRC
mgnify:CR=1 FL=1